MKKKNPTILQPSFYNITVNSWKPLQNYFFYEVTKYKLIISVAKVTMCSTVVKVLYFSKEFNISHAFYTV